MELVVIFGPPAVGKMSVGLQLAKLTGFKLFYNHLSLDLVNHFFDFGTPAFERLDKKIRFSIFQDILESELQGLIFTVVWALNLREDWDYMEEIFTLFRKYKTEIHLVELEASLTERIKRNESQQRLRLKPLKRDIEGSKENLLNFEKNYRMNSKTGEFLESNLFKIDNTNIPAGMAATMIANHFQLDAND